MARLGVNIDHVATIRQARGGKDPDPLAAAVLAELAGADGLVVHLREDRRHVQDRDLTLLREIISTKLDLEMATDETMAKIALNVKPDLVTLVPERRQELTTEGGLDVAAHKDKIHRIIELLRDGGIPTSLFVEPDLWGQGVGRALTDAAVHEARRRGFTLWVIASPTAREFYEKCGFSVEGEARTRFGPAIRMSR